MKEKYEKVGEIILKFNEIEFLLKQIIIKILNPKENDDRFYNQILFNNSVISFSSKLKLFRNLNSKYNWIKSKELREFIDDIYYLISVRNSLVHTENAIEFEKDSEGEIKSAYHIIDFLKSNGQFDIIRLNEASLKFNEKFTIIKNKLLEIFNEI